MTEGRAEEAKAKGIIRAEPLVCPAKLIDAYR